MFIYSESILTGEGLILEESLRHAEMMHGFFFGFEVT